MNNLTFGIIEGVGYNSLVVERIKFIKGDITAQRVDAIVYTGRGSRVVNRNYCGIVTSIPLSWRLNMA